MTMTGKTRTLVGRRNLEKNLVLEKKLPLNFRTCKQASDLYEIKLCLKAHANIKRLNYKVLFLKYMLRSRIPNGEIVRDMTRHTGEEVN